MITFEHWKKIDSCTGNNTTWEILGYPIFQDLRAGTHQLDLSRLMTEGLDLRDSLMKTHVPFGHVPIHPIYPVQHVRITLQDAGVYIESGALHFMKGRIKMSVEEGSKGLSGFLKRAAASIASGEPIIKPKYEGTGEIFLEPRRDHLFLIGIEDSQLLCDQGMFVACDQGIEITAHVNSFIGSVAGGEGIVQPLMKGSGTVLLSSPVPLEKVLRIELDNEELVVDGPHAMVSFGQISYQVERIAARVDSAASGERFVNVFRGTGEVWINLVEAKCVN